MFVFVYGTLKQGLSNHHYLSDQEQIGTAVLQDHELYAVNPYFPGIVSADTGRNCTVNGEVYQIDATCMRRLDGLEDNGHMYLRQEFSVTLDNGTETIVWIYLWNLPITPAMAAIDGPVWLPKRS